MGKNKKKSSKSKKVSPAQPSKSNKKFQKDNMKIDEKQAEPEPTRLVTLEAVLAMSSDEDDDGEMPPESEWDKATKDLSNAIRSGKFDSLVENYQKKKESGDLDEEESMEEIDDDDSEADQNLNDEAAEEEDAEGKEKESVSEDKEKSESVLKANAKDSKASGDEEEDNIDDDEENDEDDDEDDDEDEEGDGEDQGDETSDKFEQNNSVAKADKKKPEGGEDENIDTDQDEADEQIDDEEVEEVEENAAGENGENSLELQNQVHLKALRQVTQSMKRNMPWPETFDIMLPEKLPFDLKGEDSIDIHDDLKREVTFYNVALQAATAARIKCGDGGIPFSRPEDFFAEMVKTDDHMARIKDRLIFESKKIEAVAQRKAHKEQKLRSKETKAKRVAEKARNKKDHDKAVEDWAQSAASSRGGRLNDNDDQFLRNIGAKREPNKKRLAADKKYGFGGKRGRFKQLNPKSLNDMSDFNPRGNFAGGMRKRRSSQPPASSKRPGKRSRDAKRARQS